MHPFSPSQSSSVLTQPWAAFTLFKPTSVGMGFQPTANQVLLKPVAVIQRRSCTTNRKRHPAASKGWGHSLRALLRCVAQCRHMTSDLTTPCTPDIRIRPSNSLSYTIKSSTYAMCIPVIGIVCHWERTCYIRATKKCTHMRSKAPMHTHMSPPVPMQVVDLYGK